MSSCPQSQRVFASAVNGEELPPSLAAHAAGCPSCQRSLERARRFDVELRTSAASLAAPDMPDLGITLRSEPRDSTRPGLLMAIATVAGAVVVVALLLSAYRATFLPVGIDGSPPPSMMPSDNASPASPTTTPSPAPTLSAEEIASASAGATPMAIEGPPDVRNRTGLPWCGHEVVERVEFADYYDAEVRNCFLEAYEAGEPAEFVTDGLTVEGGQARSIYRHLASGEVEIFTDFTRDPLATPGWVRTMCRSIRIDHEDPAGVPFFVGDQCEEPTPLEGS